MPQTVACNTEQRVLLTIAPKTHKGKPAAIDGVAVVSVVSGDGTTEPGDAPNTFWLNSGDTPGDTVFLIDADADLGPGVLDISDTVTLQVSTANASSLGITFGNPEDKPDATPPPAPGAAAANPAAKPA